jgi:hypothetical protein
MVRRGEDRLDLGVELEGADRPVGIFRFPAGDPGIMASVHYWDTDIRDLGQSGNT